MWRAAIGFFLCLSLTVGCAPIVSWRTEMAHHYQASQAWKEHKSQLDPGQDRDADFAHGWKLGYFDSACGSNGAPPPVPPERYWKPYFQTPEGRKRVDAWYEGYHYGAVASEQDGAPELARIPTAPGLGTPPPQFVIPSLPPPTTVPAEEVLPEPEAYGSFGHPTTPPLAVAAPAARTLSTPAASAAPGPTISTPAAPPAAVTTSVVAQWSPQIVQQPAAIAATAPGAAASQQVVPPSVVPQRSPSTAAAPSPRIVADSASTAVVAPVQPSVAPPAAAAPQTEGAAERKPAGPLAGSPLVPAIAPPAVGKAIGPPTVVEPQADGETAAEFAPTIAKATPRSAPAGHLPAGEPTRQMLASKRQQTPAPPAVMEAKREPLAVPQPTVAVAAEPVAAAAIVPPQAEPAPERESAARIAGQSKRRAQALPAVARATEPQATVEEEQTTQSEPIAARKTQTAVPTKQPAPAAVVDAAPSALPPAPPKPAAIAESRSPAAIVQPPVAPAAGPPPAARMAQNSQSLPSQSTVPQVAETKKTAVQAPPSAVRMVLRGNVRPRPTLAIVPPAGDVDSPAAVSQPTPVVVQPPQPVFRPAPRVVEPIAAEPVAKNPDAVGPAQESQPAKVQQPTVAKKKSAPSSTVAEQPARAPVARPVVSPVPLAAPTSSLVWSSPGPEQFVAARPSAAAGSPARAGKSATLDGEKPLVMALDYGPSPLGTLRIVRILESPESAWAVSIGDHSSSGKDQPGDLTTPKKPAGGTSAGSRGVESTAAGTTIRYR